MDTIEKRANSLDQRASVGPNQSFSHFICKLSHRNRIYAPSAKQRQVDSKRIMYLRILINLRCAALTESSNHPIICPGRSYNEALNIMNFKVSVIHQEEICETLFDTIVKDSNRRLYKLLPATY